MFKWLVRSMSCLSGLCAVCSVFLVYVLCVWVAFLSFYFLHKLVCYAHVFPCNSITIIIYIKSMNCM